MPAKLTLYPSQRAARFLVIREGETLVVGRDPSCGLVVEDLHVSKRHARLRWTGRGWTLEDLGSKNGTFLNGAPPGRLELRAGDRISFGGLAARFELLTTTQAEVVESERLARIQTSAALRRRLRADLDPADLLLRLLEAAMEVTGTERGFVLTLGPDGSLHAEVASGFRLEDVQHEGFGGSVGVVRQALATGGLVVVSDVPADPTLGKRPSVVALGIGRVACAPLRHADKVIGLIYVDSRIRGRGFTTLDLEILEALADHAAGVLAGHAPEQGTPRPLSRHEMAFVSQLQRRLDELLPEV